MEVYIQKRQNTVAQYISTKLLLDLCDATKRTQGARVRMWWWEQAGIKMANPREMAMAAVEADEDGLEE